ADPTLLSPLEKTRQSIDSNFQKFSSRITRSLEEKSKIEVQQLEKILANLLPDQNYQERVLSMVYFCIKYGLDFVDRLYAALPDAVDKHHVVEL
ncbi:MAG: bacillithiol biosynthesis BshC, partial [Calditrichaeota bacterium]|nr:bacillithiol biosynthesis BshC [Calditrichota bacterium]